MKQRIAIVDYGLGNTRSVQNALSWLGYTRVSISDRPIELGAADVLILPGVGAFDVAIRNLRERGLEDVLGELVLAKGKPILGICVGMQLLATESEENGLHRGLNWIPGRVRRLDTGGALPVPHVGWNSIAFRRDAAAFSRVPESAHFYFDHSYTLDCDPRYVAATADYGTPVTAAVEHGNIHGVQFHPEKSQTNGLRLFRSLVSTVA